VPCQQHDGETAYMDSEFWKARNPDVVGKKGSTGRILETVEFTRKR
jgi:hypothetical protein